LAVNGASVAAMLAFIAQISGKSEVMLRGSFISVVIFAAGLALAMLVPYFRHHHSKVAERRETARPPLLRSGTNTLLELVEPPAAEAAHGLPHVTWWLYTGAQYLSIVAFLSGFSYLAYVGYGQAAVLNQIVAKDCK